MDGYGNLAIGLVVGGGVLIALWLALRSLGAKVERPETAAGRAVPADLRDELRALLAAGKKIQAIKRLREAHRVGLKEAKEAVERLEATGELVTAPPPAPPTSGEPEVEALVAAGKVIEAIKRYRELHGVTLLEAKQAVDAMRSS